MIEGYSDTHKLSIVELDWDSPSTQQVLAFARAIGARKIPSRGRLKGIEFFCIKLPWENRARMLTSDVFEREMRPDNFAAHQASVSTSV